MRRAAVKLNAQVAGWLSEVEHGYEFVYTSAYLKLTSAKPVSLTLPLRVEPYISKTMFSFFDGLVPEGWLLDLATKNWKLNPRDRMGLLMVCCKDCIGAVSIESQPESATT